MNVWTDQDCVEMADVRILQEDLHVIVTLVMSYQRMERIVQVLYIYSLILWYHDV